MKGGIFGRPIRALSWVIEKEEKGAIAPFSLLDSVVLGDLELFELIFTNTAIGADPIVGQVFKWGSGGDVCSRVTELGVIDVSTGDAFVFVHSFSLLYVFYRDRLLLNYYTITSIF
jgi:hypothetical protein